MQYKTVSAVAWLYVFELNLIVTYKKQACQGSPEAKLLESAPSGSGLVSEFALYIIAKMSNKYFVPLGFWFFF